MSDKNGPILSLVRFQIWREGSEDMNNSTFLELSFVIEGATEKVYKILSTSYVTISVTISQILSSLTMTNAFAMERNQP
jgi:hypothetical protein